MKLEVVYEDNHLLVVNKPFGMLSQGDPSGDTCVFEEAKTYIKTTYHKPGNVYIGLVHRLDRPVGGLMVLAKTSKAAARLSRMFQEKQVAKIYHAITERIPSPSQGTLIHYMKRAVKGKNIQRAFDKPLHGTKKAILEYKLLKKNEHRALLEVYPVTGRQHQIRVQLSRIGCTIMGDVKYGKSAFNFDQSIALMAVELSFQHPVRNQPVTFRVPYPNNEIWEPFHS